MDSLDEKCVPLLFHGNRSVFVHSNSACNVLLVAGNDVAKRVKGSMEVGGFHGHGCRLLFHQTWPLGPHSIVVHLLKFRLHNMDLLFLHMIRLALMSCSSLVATLLGSISCQTNIGRSRLGLLFNLFFKKSNLFLLGNQFRMLKLSLRL